MARAGVRDDPGFFLWDAAKIRIPGHIRKTAFPVPNWRSLQGGWVLFLRRLFDVFHDLAGFDAGSANGKLFGGAVNLGPDGLEVRIPASFGPVLSV